MKKNTFIALMALTVLIVTMSACKKDDPKTTACINTTSTSYNTGQTVSFTSCSEESVTYEWNFGDGTTSNLQNPSHTYDASGSYTVTLVVTGTSGTATTTKTVTVSHTADNYVGTYSASEVCDIGNDNYLISVTMVNANTISIDNFFGSSVSVIATVNNGAVTINNQTIANSGGVTVSGNGTLSANTNLLILNYTLNDGTNTASCTASCARQ